MVEHSPIRVKVVHESAEFRKNAIRKALSEFCGVWAIVFVVFMLPFLVAALIFPQILDSGKMLRWWFISLVIISTLIALVRAVLTAVIEKVWLVDGRFTETEFTFTEKGVNLKTENSDGFAEWGVFDRVAEKSDRFNVYFQEKYAYQVPKRFFQDKEEIEAFRSLVRDKNTLKVSP